MIDEKQLDLHKKLAEMIISDLFPALQKITIAAENLANEIFENDVKLQDSSTIKNVYKFSNKSDEKRKKLTVLLVLKNRIEVLINRNKERLSYFSKFQNDSESSQSLINLNYIEKIKSDTFENEDININQNGKNAKKEIYIDGKKFYSRNNILDFSIDENIEILKSSDEKFVASLIKSDPMSVKTITTDLLFETDLKEKLLKGIAVFIYDESKTKDFQQINKKMGGILNFKKEIPKDVQSFVSAISNLFNYMIKAKLAENFPEQISYLNDKLKCNQKTELIPHSKRVAVLSQGLAGKIENEEFFEEEDRKEKEKQNLEVNDFINFLLDEVKKVEDEEKKEQAKKQTLEKERMKSIEIQKKTKISENFNSDFALKPNTDD